MVQMVKKKICLQFRRPGFNLWIKKFPGEKEWQPTPLFLPEESHGARNLGGYSPQGCKKSDTTGRLTFLLSKFQLLNA